LWPSIRSRSSKPKDWLQMVTPRTSAPRNIIRFIEPHLLCLWITGVFVPLATLSPRGCDPRTFCGRPVEPFRDSRDRRLLPPPGCPTGTVMPRGTEGLSASRGKRLERVQVFFRTRLARAHWVRIDVGSARVNGAACGVTAGTDSRCDAA
jgi:hypothetical protein